MSESTNGDQFNIFGDGALDLGSQPIPDPFAGTDFAQSAPVPQAPIEAAPQPPIAAIPQAPVEIPLPVAVQATAEAVPQSPAPMLQQQMTAQAAAVAPQPPQPENPLAAAIEQAEQKQAVITADALFSKAPVFDYAGATEEIEDTTLTFEQLRVSKSEDFPELEDGKRVSWSMEYCKITKQVTAPGKTVIGDLKKEIESSKAFLDALKKAKDKNPVCKVKPRISAQSKGIAGYKGVFASLEEAEQSDKHICILPGRDGHVYEMRRTDVGRFVARVDNVKELSEISAGFTPALPPIPRAMTEQIVAFFRYFVENGQDCEVMVHVYWDKTEQRHIIRVPMQTVSKASITVTIPPEEELDHERYIHMADIHSHDTMRAFFSSCDDRDEQATRAYVVIGNLGEPCRIEMNARISVGGRFVPIPPDQILEAPSTAMTTWGENDHFFFHNIKHLVNARSFSPDFPREWIAPVHVTETRLVTGGCHPLVDFVWQDELLLAEPDDKPSEQLYRRFFRWVRRQVRS